MNYEKISPELAALIFEYQRFPEATAASMNGTRPQPLSLSPDGKLQTFVSISSDGEVRTAQIELDRIAALTEQNEVKYLACSIPEAANNGDEKSVVIVPNRFAPARIAFVVPSNSEPGSPREVVIRGWFAGEGDCEITVLSPGGGTTRSIQAEVVAGNPTRFGNYHSSQAFLTKPEIAFDGRREFFINVRPIAPHRFVTGGTWKLTIVNVGDREVEVNLKTRVDENAKTVFFR